MKGLLLLSFFSLVLATACGPRFVSRIDLARQFDWEPEQFILNPDLETFHAEGAVSITANGDRHKVDYEIFRAAPTLWRIDVFGFFHTHGATVVIDGAMAHVFHNGVWEDPRPWPEVALNLFGMVFPYKVLSIMLGGRFDFAGECDETIEGKVCREGDLYYLIRRGILVEIKSTFFNIIYSEGQWRGEAKKNDEPFYLWPRKIEKRTEFDPAMFRTTYEKDIFDEI